MTRALVILPLLLAACAHQQRTALPLTDSCNTTTCHGTRCETTTLACSVPLDVDVDEDAPLDEGGGGFLPVVPYYVAHETMAQAAPPVGSPSWLAQAYSMTLSAPNGSVGVTLNAGAKIEMASGSNRSMYYDTSAVVLALANMGVQASGDIIGNAALYVSGLAYLRGGIQNDTGTDPVTVSDAQGLAVTGGVYASGGFIQSIAASAASNQTTSPFNIDDAEGLRLQSTAALPTCAAAIEGTYKRDGTTGAASSGARTRMCLCTSDGAASPAYQWINAVSGTVGTATTCPL